MKIALAQFNPTIGDFEGNSSRILALAKQARQRGADESPDRIEPLLIRRHTVAAYARCRRDDIRRELSGC